MKKIAYITSHPVQYLSPLFLKLSASKIFSFKAIFQSNLSLKPFFNKDFSEIISWGDSLLDGYNYLFLPKLQLFADKLSYFFPINYGLFRELLVEDYDFVIVHGYNRPFNWFAILLCNILGSKVILRDDINDYGHTNKFKNALRKIMFILLRLFVYKFFYVGKKNKEFFLKYTIPGARLSFFPWCSDTSFFSSFKNTSNVQKKLLSIPKKSPVVLFVGKFIDCKRVEDLLEAICLLGKEGDITLILAGNGPLYSKYKRISEQNKMNVIFPGFLRPSDLKEYYQIADILVVPSERETWGMVVNEAMSSGTAILASDGTGSAYDLVRNGYNGYIFQKGDVTDLKEKLDICFTDRVLLSQMKKNSLLMIKQWNFDLCLQNICKLVQG